MTRLPLDHNLNNIINSLCAMDSSRKRVCATVCLDMSDWCCDGVQHSLTSPYRKKTFIFFVRF